LSGGTEENSGKPRLGASTEDWNLNAFSLVIYKK